MRTGSIVAVLVAMIGFWLIVGNSKNGFFGPSTNVGESSSQAQLSRAHPPECAVIGGRADTFRCEVVGNPNAERWPDNTAEHSFARSVWDMESAEVGSRAKRIYLGGGDWGLNQGPAPVWSLFWRKPEEGKPSLQIAPEQPLYGEAVEFFREIDGRLYVPDIDPKDPWTFGNVYALGTDGWFKYRGLQNAVHVFDIIGFQNRLVASAGVVENSNGLAGLFTSSDRGETWARLPVPETEAQQAYRFWRMAAYGERLFVAQSNARSGYWTLDRNWKLRAHPTDLFPDMGEADLRVTVSRAVDFEGDVLYTPGLERMPVNAELVEAPLAPKYKSNVHFANWWKKIKAARPILPRNLYRLNQAGVVSVVQVPEAIFINDVIVIGGVIYVLGVSFEGGAYQASIHSSRNMSEWNEIVRVETPAVAYSFARLDGDWFLGLAADGMTDVNAASGEILRVYSG